LDFALNEQQEMMQTMARDFLTSEYPDKVLKEMARDEKGFTPELWQKMAGMNLLPRSGRGAGRNGARLLLRPLFLNRRSRGVGDYGSR